MNLIKLNAIDSTNSYLRSLVSQKELEDFSVVLTNHQQSGRGQMGTVWNAEKGKNLTCSVFKRNKGVVVHHQFYISMVTSLAIVKTLQEFHIPKIAVKWPNDILSSNKKLCGVLVENVMQKDEIKSSIIGIGLNVNQEEFPKELSSVTSIKNEIGKDVNIDILLQHLINELKQTVSYITDSSTNVLKKNYLKWLYKKNIPTMFKNSKDVLFMGKIVGVSAQGKLQVELEDETINEFTIKEVSFA